MAKPGMQKLPGVRGGDVEFTRLREAMIEQMDESARAAASIAPKALPRNRRTIASPPTGSRSRGAGATPPASERKRG